MSLTVAFVLFVFMSTFGWGRAYRRREAVSSQRLRELEETMATRDQELDQLHERVAELETRLDFAERLLAKGGER